MIRSIVLNVVLFSALAVFILSGIFFLPCSERIVYRYWYYLSKMFNFIVKYVGGISFSIEGKENIFDSAAIYAIRHESMWETFALTCLFKKPVFIVKKELYNIPIFGPLAKKTHSIFVDRDQGARALIETSNKISEMIKDNRQIIIFPEGTRVPNGTYVPLKRGIALFYKKNNCPVIPVIHNSGFFWARRSFKKNPGNITLKFMKPIAPGLPQDEFMDKLNEVFQTEIEKLKESELESCH